MTRNKTQIRVWLLGTAMTAALAGPSAAQAPALMSEEEMANLVEECRLVADDYAQLGDEQIITREEMTRILTLNQATECDTVRQRLTQEDSAVATDEVQLEQQAVIEGQAQVRVPDPQVDVQVPPPQVTVRKAQPQVQISEQPTDIQVRQEQPRISIEVPQILVTVEIPAPTIYIRSSQPDVQVSNADPEVEVVQGDPQVSVRQGDPELTVDLDVDQDADAAETATTQAQGAADQAAAGEAQAGMTSRTEGNVRLGTGEAQVEMVQPEGEAEYNYTQAEPQVSFEQAEAQVTVSMPDQPTVELVTVGEPSVTFETKEERQARRQQEQQQQQQAAGQPAAEQQAGQQQAGQQPAAGLPQTVTVGQLMDMRVVGAEGEDVGTPHAIVGEGDQVMLVLRDGGFLGFGGREIGIPISRVMFGGDHLQLSTMTAEEIESAGGFEFDDNARLEDSREIEISG
ncbi:MAG: hypothetical protein JG765_541 [Cereibacter sp.]|jgi:hypothetical protein|nr:hypothetical protein [Cereibacter sp.]